MDPSGDDYDSSNKDGESKPQNCWYRKKPFDFYRYEVDEDGIVQKIMEVPAPDEHRGRRQAKSPQRGILKSNSTGGASSGVDTTVAGAASYRAATPVTFSMPARKAPKYQHNTPLLDKDHGPGHLNTLRFQSKESEGNNWWYDSQAPNDLDFPLPVNPALSI
ncbi:hypothetical protein BT96DRAFT_1022962 [Gymnopus androsaceus JB14]|uniref:Uncharacterized protein n=1 Tax=Gymnopus androsaceus JB14 TaxID=1447944 RepID=A0A6A4H614_9AGAR|nr:hypothetical protein BT96DRAFT_1022962 [Gymnopus androsaceus JB14]